MDLERQLQEMTSMVYNIETIALNGGQNGDEKDTKTEVFVTCHKLITAMFYNASTSRCLMLSEFGSHDN